MARNFVIVSGGPGIYVACDPDHDKSWSNYVDNILLLAANSNFPKQSDEEVWWLVYEPAYDARWNDDVANGRQSTKDIKAKGSASYKNHLEKRAKKYSWKLRWLTKADDFWSKLKTFRDPVSRVWYFGHARDDLWLSLNHSGCTAVAPASSAIIRYTDIASQTAVKTHMQAGGSKYDANRSSRFYGCNSAKFAQEFAKAYGVYAEGAVGNVDFTKAHSAGGKLNAILTGCSWKTYDTSGTSI